MMRWSDNNGNMQETKKQNRRQNMYMASNLDSRPSSLLVASLLCTFCPPWGSLYKAKGNVFF